MRISDWSSDVCSSDLPTTASVIAPSGTGGSPAHVSFSGGGLIASTLLFPQALKHSAANGASRIITFRRSEEHTSELQSLMRISYAVFCLKKKNNQHVQIKLKQLTETSKTIHIKIQL